MSTILLNGKIKAYCTNRIDGQLILAAIQENGALVRTVLTEGVGEYYGTKPAYSMKVPGTNGMQLIDCLAFFGDGTREEHHEGIMYCLEHMPWTYVHYSPAHQKIK